jgi:hypothetical protein
MKKENLQLYNKPTTPAVKVCYIPAKNSFSGSINHDLFRHRKGLAKTGFEIYKALFEYEILDIKQIEEITGLNLHTIYRKLRIMTGYNIAIKQDKKYRLNPSMSLDQAAGILGVAGKGEKQKRQHKADRDSFKKKRRDFAKGIEESQGAIKH